MDRRVFLALVLSAAVVVVFQLLFPPPKRPLPSADSARVAATATSTSTTGAATALSATGATPSASAAPVADSAAAAAAPRLAAETTTVDTKAARYRFSSLGARPIGTQVLAYQALGARGQKTGTPVEIVRGGEALVTWTLVLPGDSIPLAKVPFTLVRSGDAARPTLQYSATVTGRQGTPVGVTIAYAVTSDYLLRVDAQVTGAPARSFLLASLPTTLASSEADTVEDSRHRAIAYKPANDNAKGLPFAKIPAGERVLGQGPLTWAVAKSKYFIVGFLTPEKGRPFREVQVGAARTANVSRLFGSSVVTTAANAAVVNEIPADGRVAFEIYAGPQEFERLASLGRSFEDSNPYGGFLQGVVQPFATLVMKILLWMKRNLSLSYGWILVIFGITVRLVMWPFQQRAMRSSMVMQRIQPELQKVQEKHRNDPQKMQAELMKIYKQHGVSPFSAFSGCLPMLIPMPVFFALFFVFQNTIEFRGVPFLWLTDISLYDPYFILPVVMGLSSWALAWVGMRNAPPNPQAKMMSYMFPAMMTWFLWKFASGLNLYYTVQNMAALPQQWMLANERAKAQKK